jgi:hypothetical protein
LDSLKKQVATGVLAFAVGTLLVFYQRYRSHKGVEGGFDIDVRDEKGASVPCRVHLRGVDGKFWKPPNWPAFADHFVFSGKATLPIPAGSYTYEIERGPEYRNLKGSFLAGEDTSKALHLQLERVADLASQGWYSGDLHIHRAPEDVELLMRAEDIYVGPVVTWWNSDDRRPSSLATEPTVFDGSRLMHPTAGEDERQGGALLYFRLAKPLELPPSMRDEKGHITHQEGDLRDEYPAPAEFARAARADPRAHIEIEKPFWWDVPSWVALGFADSIAIAYNQMTRDSLHNGEAWGKWRDRNIYGGPFGDALWTQDIYYRILDSGIRLAPSAGSASGTLPNPVGYNRVYVHLDGPLDYDAWWRGLKAGNSFVTNGPLLLVRANGQLPGHVFANGPGTRIEIALETRIVSNEPIGRVELIRDGRPPHAGTIAADGSTATFESFAFEQSGWFLVRAFAARTDNFRFASTAPFYVEVGPASPRISRSAVQFFIDWIEERMRGLAAGTMPPDKLESVMAFQRQAKRLWQDRLSRANGE